MLSAVVVRVYACLLLAVDLDGKIAVRILDEIRKSQWVQWQARETRNVIVCDCLRVQFAALEFGERAAESRSSCARAT